MKPLKYFLVLIYSAVVLNLLLSSTQVLASHPGGTHGLPGAFERLTNVGKDVYGGAPRPLEDVIGGIIQSALAIVGVVFLGLTVYGGYLWMLAREDEAQAKKAMQIIKMAVIGLGVVLAAYAITFFIVARLTRAVQ